MIKRLAISTLFSLFFTACQSPKPDFSLPERLDFQGKTYQKVTDNRLDEMRQALYLNVQLAKDPNNWTDGILLFVDRNSTNISLAERATLREVAFATQPNTQAKITINTAANGEKELTSQVIYPPTERFNDVQLEASRGRESRCGYEQMQVSLKKALSAKKSPNFTASSYQTELANLATALSQMAWQIGCQ